MIDPSWTSSLPSILVRSMTCRRRLRVVFLIEIKPKVESLEQEVAKLKSTVDNLQSVNVDLGLKVKEVRVHSQTIEKRLYGFSGFLDSGAADLVKVEAYDKALASLDPKASGIVVKVTMDMAKRIERPLVEMNLLKTEIIEAMKAGVVVPELTTPQKRKKMDTLIPEGPTKSRASSRSTSPNHLLDAATSLLKASFVDA